MSRKFVAVLALAIAVATLGLSGTGWAFPTWDPCANDCRYACVGLDFDEAETTWCTDRCTYAYDVETSCLHYDPPAFGGSCRTC
jgi:hypothetical protein